MFFDLAALVNVEVSKTGIDAHSTLGLCERYNQPLRRIYLNNMVERLTTDPHLALVFSVKAINDIIGPERFVPSALVFGEYPGPFTRLETPGNRSVLAERSHVAQTACTEMSKLIAKVQMSRVLKHAVPSVADQQ